MRRWRFAWAWTIGVVLALALPGCGGNVPIPDDCRLLGCAGGLVCIEGEEGTWSCQEPPPCEETGCPDGQVCIEGKCEPKPPWKCELEMPGCHETGQTCSTPEEPCWHNPTSDPEHCEVAPECPPPPPPPPLPPPPPPPGRCPQGEPQAAGPKLHGNDVYDATPRVCRADWTPDCYEGRICHPVACEGEEHAADREFCERELMGGPAPVWELEVESGDLHLVESDWFGVVRGHGKGRLRWHFPNGRATSKWLDVNR